MSEKVDIYMPMYWGDYFRDTLDLSAEESGAYLHIIGHMWTHGATIDLNHDRLARIAKVDRSRWLDVWSVISRYFRVAYNQITHGRVAKELGKAKSKRTARSESGRRGAATRWQTPQLDDGDTNGKRNGEPMANAMANPLAKPWQSESESESEIEAGSCAEPDEPASTPPADLTLVPDDPEATKDPEDPVVMEFPVIGDPKQKTWPLTAHVLGLYREAFPGLDVEAAFKRAQLWANNNPAKRKTARGMRAFLQRWLEKDANSGRTQANGARASPAGGSANRGNELRGMRGQML